MSKQALMKMKSAGTGKAIYGKLDKEIQLFIHDRETHYQNFNSKTPISFSDFLSNRILIVEAIKKGLPYSIFKLIQIISPFTFDDWAIYLDISTKSLVRYRQQGKRFKSIHSEKIIEIAEVTNLGLEVFNDAKKFKLWLETPNYSLGDQKPFDLLKDSYGKEMVIGELTRIDHGILA
jgi:putative toxin-antitoxin system antitoxin component (TIGR02293 family)